MTTSIDILNQRFNLSPYQMYVLAQNGYKYNMNKIKKVGHVIYAPYRCGIPLGFKDWVRKIMFGPRADLIDSDRIIVTAERVPNVNKMLKEI